MFSLAGHMILTWRFCLLTTVALRFSLTYDNKSNQVSYTPYIDEKRDKELLEHLPDYLTDEIEFERQFEARFFWRMLSFNNDDTRRE